ncbi:hypothetical protein DSM104299_01682 [Baekduia alba]|uniref:hypothetical protein n=1 Tax=Baekduia alba TaxID=2997333 RepID=UPI00234074F2|nr:hypothetical protein [Baekduia alba]WCB92981.1 hypothetical protein DSM104299_01682 [Baekduia alba]
MSIEQRNDACLIAVDREVGQVLRLQTLVVLEANHHHFEDVRGLGPDAQRALARIYRDAFSVLDAVGWDPADDAGAAAARRDVPLTAGHMDQLWRRRRELGFANLDRLDLDGPDVDLAALTADREAAQTLDRLQAEFALAVAPAARRA